MQIFEVGDVVLLDDTKDVGASNRRHLAALYCGATSGFEVPFDSNTFYLDLSMICKILISGDLEGSYR